MFDTFRDEGWNTYYGTKRYPPAHHVPHYIIGYFTVVVATAFFIFVLSSRGRERWGALIRLIFNLHTAVVILFCLTGQEWSVAYVHSKGSYSPDIQTDLQARIGLHVGLRSVNITFIADQNTTELFGQIYYNEEFSFRGSTDLERALKYALKRGLPYSMLYILEYFEVDAGGLRWSRILRTAGHFAYILLWAALVLWIVSQMLIGFVVSRGLVINLASGVCMISSVFIYHGIHPDIPLAIPFPDGFLQLHYGWCFWLVCGSGIFTVLYSVIMLLLYFREPEWTMDLLLSDVAEVDSYQNSDDGVLQIMTPYNERKVKVEREKNYFVNDCFADDECKINLEKCPDVDKGHLDSESDVLIEMDYREAIKPEPVQPARCSSTKRTHDAARSSQLMTSKPSLEIPPDYSSTEETEVGGATGRNVRGEVGKGIRSSVGALPSYGETRASATQEAAL